MRRLLAALAALLLLVVGTMVLLSYVRGADARALAGVRTVQVLVAEQLIPEGTAADQLDGMVHTALVPAKSAVEGRVRDLDALVGRVATVDVLPGEQLLAARFERPEDMRAPDSVDVPAGLQEVSVLLEPERVIGGRLAAGDTVGVYLSQVLPDGTKQTSDVLHHVLVTQVQGAPSSPDPGADAEAQAAAAATPSSSLMLTLAVVAKDAELVVFGMEHGTLWLSLETAGDDVSGTRVIDQTNVYAEVPR